MWIEREWPTETLLSKHFLNPWTADFQLEDLTKLWEWNKKDVLQFKEEYIYCNWHIFGFHWWPGNLKSQVCLCLWWIVEYFPYDNGNISKVHDFTFSSMNCRIMECFTCDNGNISKVHDFTFASLNCSSIFLFHSCRLVMSFCRKSASMWLRLALGIFFFLLSCFLYYKRKSTILVNTYLFVSSSLLSLVIVFISVSRNFLMGCR